MKKKKIINILLEIIYYSVFFAFLLMVKTYFSSFTEYDFTVFLAVASFSVGLLLLSGPHFNKYLGFILGSFYSLYLLAQRIYYRATANYFRVSTVFTSFRTMLEEEGGLEGLYNFKDLLPLITITGITVLFLILRYVLKCKTKYRAYIRLLSVLFFAVSVFLMNDMVNGIKDSSISEGQPVYETDQYIYDTVKNPKAFVDKFGLLTFAYRDTETLLIRGKNVVAYKGEINSYFNSQSSVRFYNDYTGIFKDKSLLIIQAEELNSAAITPELTPVLYEMLNNSIEIKKFETPVLTGEDGDSEFMANTSFLPETDLYPVAYKYVDNIYPLTLGNIFKENGYAANAFYSSNGDDFNRNTTFGTYGYEFMDGARLETETDAPDSSMTEKIGWINAEKERFCSFWIARNFHGPYERESIGVSEDDFARVKEVYPGIRTELAAYFAKVMDLDRALDTFFKVMEWSGKKDQVIVIIYAQHRVDGIDFGENSAYSRLEKNVQEDDEDTVDDKRDPETTDDEDREPVEIGSRVDDPLFIIYGPGLEHQVIEKYCTCLDILPTVMNLWGINYDAKYAFGNDILDDTYSGLCFDEEGNYWNDDLYYESSSNYVRVNGDFPKNSAADIVNDFNYKRSICNRILKTDYFDVIK